MTVEEEKEFQALWKQLAETLVGDAPSASAYMLEKGIQHTDMEELMRLVIKELPADQVEGFWLGFFGEGMTNS